jgi:hypothetical protein
MDASRLSAQLRHWADEFCSVSEKAIDVPDRLWPFLASRLVELGIAEDDPDVVSAKIVDTYRKVRITGTHADRLQYESVDGGVGFGLIQRRDIHPDDHGKLSKILERLLQDGKVGGRA